VGAVALIVAAMSFGVSSALARKLPLPPSKIMSSGAQMLAGGVLLPSQPPHWASCAIFHPGNRLMGSVGFVALPDRPGLHHRVYRLRLADPS